MRPENVNPKNFDVEKIIYDDGIFSIAYGNWQNRHMHLAMRWNGDKEEDIGYPKVFSHPMWFQIPENLKIPILKALINLEGSIPKNILDTLEKEI